MEFLNEGQNKQEQIMIVCYDCYFVAITICIVYLIRRYLLIFRFSWNFKKSKEFMQYKFNNMQIKDEIEHLISTLTKNQNQELKDVDWDDGSILIYIAGDDILEIVTKNTYHNEQLFKKTKIQQDNKLRQPKKNDKNVNWRDQKNNQKLTDFLIPNKQIINQNDLLQKQNDQKLLFKLKFYPNQIQNESNKQKVKMANNFLSNTQTNQKLIIQKKIEPEKINEEKTPNQIFQDFSLLDQQKNTISRMDRTQQKIKAKFNTSDNFYNVPSKKNEQTLSQNSVKDIKHNTNNQLVSKFQTINFRQNVQIKRQLSVSAQKNPITNISKFQSKKYNSFINTERLLNIYSNSNEPKKQISRPSSSTQRTKNSDYTNRIQKYQAIKTNQLEQNNDFFY